MLIHQIRNATLIITYKDKKFLIDPWLMPKDYIPVLRWLLMQMCVNQELNSL